MGLSEPSLKPFSSLSHCKVSCDSPCCVKIRTPHIISTILLTYIIIYITNICYYLCYQYYAPPRCLELLFASCPSGSG